MFRSLAATCVLVAAVGCATTSRRRAQMDPPAGASPEEHAMWARPQEVGYEIGGEISGEAQSFSILFGLLSFGAEDAGGVFGWPGALVGDVMGLKPLPIGTDPLIRAAAGDAVGEATGTDGIYITQQQTSSLDFFLVKIRTATVRGRALKLKPIGEVSQERADRFRNLRALSGGQLHIPEGVLEWLK